MDGTMILHLRDSVDDCMKWMSKHDPTLLSKYRNLSTESQARLRNLLKLSQQASNSATEVIKTIKRCDSEFDGLAKKFSNHLQYLVMDHELELSDDSYTTLQESATIILKGNYEYGTEIGAAASLTTATAVLAKAASARQKLSLTKDIKIIHMKNENLKETLEFYSKELKAAKEEIMREQLAVKSAIDNTGNLVDFSRTNEKFAAMRLQLDDLGISPNISSQIMETYQELGSLEGKIKVLKEKLKKFGLLPPSIVEATKLVENTRRHLASVVEDFKSKLTAFYTT